MDEQPSNMPTWSWPERYEAGKTSQPQSPGSTLAPSQPDPQQPTQQPSSADKLSRAMAARSTVATLAATILSAAASFGLGLDEAQTQAVVSVVSAIAAIAVLVRSRNG